jgi:serine/threonine-protein kinase RsbW
MTSAEGRWDAPATADHVAAVRQDVARFALDQGFGQDRTADVALAVSEALTNIVLHAYRDGGANGEPGRMRAEARINRDGLLVVDIGDDGVGMLPNPCSPGLGLGVPIMRRLSDSVDLEAGGGGPGGLVRLRFARA